MVEPAVRLDVLEQQLEKAISFVPYALLAISTALSVLVGVQPWQERLVTVGLAALAALWIWLMAGLRPPGPVYVAGLIALIAILGLRDPWFAGFFGFAGYVQSWHYLRGGWRIVGVAATAAVTVTTFMGGVLEASPAGVLAYALVVTALVLLVVLFSFFGDVTAQRSAERTRMVERLVETIRENEALHAQLLRQAREAGVLDERQRIASDIHDTLAQNFAGIITQLQAAAVAADRTDEAGRRRHIHHATELAREGLEEARRSVRAIAPKALDASRLPEALAALSAEWSERSGVHVEMTTTGTARALHPEVETTLLRVTQEALTNAAKHARASRAGVTLSYMDDLVSVDVRDDGIGFDPDGAESDGGFGIISMRERAARLSGRLEIESARGAGTAVSATIPAISRESP